MHYYTTGNPKKPHLICLHGFMGSGLDWQAVADILTDNCYLIMPDLPGHGLTRVNGDAEAYKMENTASLLVQFTLEKKFTDVSLLGYSMGGRLALFLGVRYPKIWSALILESSSPGLESAEERAARIRHDWSLAGQLENNSFDAFVKNWYNQPIFDSLRKTQDFKPLLARRFSNNPAALAMSLRMMGTGQQPSLWDEIENLKLPVLLLAGEFDRKFQVIMAKMQKKINRSELKIIYKTGHNIHYESPLLYTESIMNFFKPLGRTVYGQD